MEGGGVRASARWLLIGNSRWHWAEQTEAGLRHWSETPAAGPESGSSPALRGWAAVGPLPQGLDPAKRVSLAQVPLASAPCWLGVDRALAGYEAWIRSAGAVLVADAGTTLSLTWIDGGGHFCGGRLMAGAGLQLQALHRGTQALPALSPAALGMAAADPWPQTTDAAMAVGVLEGMAGALERAAAQLWHLDPSAALWLTGGDAERLLPLLQEPSTDGGQPWRWAPGLCLEGLARVAGISPGQDP